MATMSEKIQKAQAKADGERAADAVEMSKHRDFAVEQFYVAYNASLDIRHQEHLIHIAQAQIAKDEARFRAAAEHLTSVDLTSIKRYVDQALGAAPESTEAK